MGDDVTVPKKSKHRMAKEELGLVGIDVRDGMPRTVPHEDTACDDGTHVRVPRLDGARGEAGEDFLFRESLGRELRHVVVVP